MSHAPLPPLPARFADTSRSVVRELLARTRDSHTISLAGGLPAPELFDIDGARQAFDRVLRDDAARALQYSPSEGDPRLREQLAARCTAAGLRTHPDQIVVTTGAQQALTLVATTLVEPGDVVLVERPSYLAALQVFALSGARLVDVPSDADGIDPAALDQLAREHLPALLYLVPTFQNPTGGTLSADRRREVVGIAERRGFRVVEDDPYRELRYSGAPEPTLASLADGEHVLYTGTLSKILAPGLRAGWVRTTPSVHDALVLAKQAGDLHTSTVDQAAAAVYLDSGRLEPNLERARRHYRERRDALVAALAEALPPGSTWTRPDGGMFLWVRLPEGIDTDVVLADALARGVAFAPGRTFFSSRPQIETMRLCFATYPPQVLTEAAGRLGEAVAAAVDLGARE